MRSFWCFISYRHADNKELGRQWATWLHQAIETYEVPSDLVGTQNQRGETIPDRIFPVFRDEDELPVDADLASPIYRALDESKYLLVLCSPRSVASPYVANEIRYFKKLGREDRVLAAIIDGEPNVSWDTSKHALGFLPEQECFPEPLRHRVDDQGRLLQDRTEPVAADFRLRGGLQGWTSPRAHRQAMAGKFDRPTIDTYVQSYQHKCELNKLKIIAGILGVGLGTLTKRDAAYQLALAQKRSRTLRRWLAVVGLLAFLAAAGAIFGFVGQKNAETNLAASESNAYVSSIRAAAALLIQGKTDEARDILAKAPPRLRRWEWGLLMEKCGPPMLTLPALDPKAFTYDGTPDIPRAIFAAAPRDPTPSDTMGDAVVVSPHGTYVANFRPNNGSAGSEITVSLAPPKTKSTKAPTAPATDSTPPLIDLRTPPYGAIDRAFFLDDESLLVAGFSDPIEEDSSPSFVDPIRVTPAAPSPAHKADAGTNGDTLFTYRVVPVPPARPALQLSKEGEDTFARPDASRILRLLSPAEIQRVIELSKVENFLTPGGYRIRFRRLADVRHTDHTLALFNYIYGDTALEIWDLTDNKCLQRLGRRAPTHENYDVWPFTDLSDDGVGGAFSRDGTKIIASPVGIAPQDEAAHLYNDTAILDVASGAELSRENQIKWEWETKGFRTTFGLSPRGTWAFHTRLEAAEDQQCACVSVATGQPLKLPRDEVDFLEWNPDESYLYLHTWNKSSIEIYTFPGLKHVGDLKNAQEDAVPAVIEAGPHPRYVIGGLVFGDDPLHPLVRLDPNWIGLSLNSNFLEAWRHQGAHGTRERLPLAERVLLDWQLKVDQL